MSILNYSNCYFITNILKPEILATQDDLTFWNSNIIYILSMCSKLDRVALLIEDPSRYNSTTKETNNNFVTTSKPNNVNYSTLC